MKTKSTLLAIILSILSFTTKAQTEIQKVAILPPAAKTENVSEMQIALIRAELAKVISGDENYQAITRINMDAITSELKFQQGGMVDDEQRAKLGSISGASIVCISTLTSDKDNLFIEASFIDVQTGRVLKYADQLMPVAPNSEIKKGCALLAQQLMGYSTNGNLKAVTKTIKTMKTKGIDMVLVEGGSFMMGCTRDIGNCETHETPAHSVTVNSFRMSKTEITVAQFARFVEATGYAINSNNWKQWCKEGDISKCDFPATSISWYDAVAFCNWAGGRLPTEAEWEYAARGGNQSQNYKYAGSNNIFDVAWFDDNSEEPPHAVATKQANELGIFDLSGNVQEWCSDWYNRDYYGERIISNPSGPNYGTFRVNRGGSWTGSMPYSRTVSRSANLPTDTYKFLGFRMVVSEP